MEKDFSIKKEIEIEVKETLGNLDVDIEKVFDSVENDEAMLNMISLSIYMSISEQLKERGIENEDVNEKIIQLERLVVEVLMDRGII